MNKEKVYKKMEENESVKLDSVVIFEKNRKNKKPFTSTFTINITNLSC